MYALKGQFCDFDSNFSLSQADSIDFMFNQPVLLESDVKDLIGSGPSEITATEGGFVHRYIIEQVQVEKHPTPLLDLELRYQVHAGKVRLQSVRVPNGIPGFETTHSFASPEAIASTAGKVCSAGLKLGLPSLEDDIDAGLLETLPSRKQLLTAIGPPTLESDKEHALVYEYQVRGTQIEAPPMRFVVWYNADGSKPLRAESRYRGFRSQLNFEEGKIRYSYGA